MVLRLDLVVELVADALAQLLRERLDVEPGREPLDQREQHLALRRSVSTASAMPGYWIFTATCLPSVVVARWTWPMLAAANASCSKSLNASLERHLELLA